MLCFHDCVEWCKCSAYNKLKMLVVTCIAMDMSFLLVLAIVDMLTIIFSPFNYVCLFYMRQCNSIICYIYMCA